MSRKREGNIGVLLFNPAAPPEPTDSQPLTDEEVQQKLIQARKIEVLQQGSLILLGLGVVAFNHLWAPSARYALWALLLFDLLAIYSGAFLTSYLTLVREAAFQAYFDPFNGLVYLAHFFDLFFSMYLLAAVYSREEPGRGSDLDYLSYLGVAATILKALVLIVKKPRRLMLSKENPDA